MNSENWHARNAEPWAPLLGEEERAQATETLIEIVGGLEEFFRLRPVFDHGFPSGSAELSLGTGHAGLALLFLEAEKVLGEAISEGTGDRILSETLESLPLVTPSPSFFYGYPGVAWLVAHLERRGLIEESPDALDAIEEALLGTLKDPPRDRAVHDVVLGLLGIGIYALERYPKGRSGEIAGRLLDVLEAAALKTPEGLCWQATPEQLPAGDRKKFKSYLSPGVSHGVAGVAGFLGGCCALPELEARAMPLLEGAFSWLLAHSAPFENGANFPLLIRPNGQRRAAPHAWCHGDPGISAVLHRAARSAGREDWQREIEVLAKRSARVRDLEEDRGDPGICHGSAGRAHLYSRLYHATGDADFGQAARFWLQEALAVRSPGVGLAGYSGELLPNVEPAKGLYRSAPSAPGLRCGVAGVALTLLAAIDAQDPSWDRAFLF
ncbi:MAG: lanthionine synthetase C family protein [Acidobacteriota bacterium]